jgi:sorbitol-specific phosphotransferase system component IIC
MHIITHILAFMFLGAIAHAAVPTLGYFDTAVAQFGLLVGRIIPVLVVLALLLFIWGIVRFISASGDEKAAEEGKNKMIWGIIALFVIVSVWGLVAFLGEVTGVDQGVEYAVPFSDF